MISDNFFKLWNQVLLNQCPQYILLPDVMARIVHSRVKIAVYFDSIKSNLSSCLETFCGYLGRLRSLAEVEFSKNISTFFRRTIQTNKYKFIHDLQAFDDDSISQEKRDFIRKFPPESFVALYANQARSIAILLAKCSEAEFEKKL